MSEKSWPDYRAVWRWHFYAGLYVIPFLLMLAVTGFFMMLFTTYLPEHGDRLPVAPQAQALPATTLAEAARHQADAPRCSQLLWAAAQFRQRQAASASRTPPIKAGPGHLDALACRPTAAQHWQLRGRPGAGGLTRLPLSSVPASGARQPP